MMISNYLYYGGFSFLYGIFFAFCFYDNFYGITFPLCVAVTLAVYRQFMKKAGMEIKKGSGWYMAGMLLLGFSTCCTSNGFFLFFNWVGTVLLFIVFMLHQFYDDREWEFVGYLKNVLFIFATFIGQIFTPFTDGIAYLRKNKKEQNEKEKRIKEILAGLLIAAVLLLIILPLLLSSDLVFQNLMSGIFRFRIGTQIVVFLFFIIGLMSCYGFFRALCKREFVNGSEVQKKTYSPAIAITFTSVLMILYSIYSAVQILYLFIGWENGLPDGVTYAEYARSGFWELLFVSFINFILVVVCMKLFSQEKVLKILLLMISVCTLIMIGSSAYRMFLYIQTYHLTFLRVLVLWFLILETFAMAGMMVNLLYRKFSLFRYLVFITSCAYILFAYSRPDVWIAKYNLSQDKIASWDISYLTYSLSIDALPVLAEFDLDKVETESEEERANMAWEVGEYMRNISDSYENIGLRKANYSIIKAKEAADNYQMQ